MTTVSEPLHEPRLKLHVTAPGPAPTPSATAENAAAVSVPARLDSLDVKWLHLAILSILGLGYFLDLMEIGFGGAFTAIFAPAQHSSSTFPVAALISSIYVGAVIGAPLFGMAADRYGRRRVLVPILGVLSDS